MKNNEYLQKYGEKALEVYKKSLKNSQQQLVESQPQIMVPKMTNRNKSGSMKSLHRSSKSKSKLHLPQDTHFTFNKPANDKNHKKLLLSGLSTPKNKSTRPTVANNQRLRSSSTKKKGSSHKISEKVHDALYKHKSIKNLVKSVIQCIDLMVQQDAKICKWVNQLKDIFYHISNQTLSYRKKWKDQTAKNKKLSREIQELQTNLKISNEKKRKSVQVVIVEENQKLRAQIQKLHQKVENFEKKQMVLISAIERLKQPNTECGGQIYEESNSKFRKQFYGKLEEQQRNEEESQEESEVER